MKIHPLKFALAVLLISVTIRAIILIPTKTQWTANKSASKTAGIEERFDKLIPQPESSVLAGMLFGAKKNIPGEFKKQLQTTGTIHIVVASGYNLTIVAGFTMALAGILSRYGATVLTLICIALYSYFVGFEPPIIRAALMASIAFTAQLFGRKNTALWALGITAFVLLLFNPSFVHDISFQLSFMATFGILYIEPLLKVFLKKLPAILSDELGVTIAAQLATLPIIMFQFGTLSIIAPLANFLVAWTIPLIMMIGSVESVILILKIPLLDQLFAVIVHLPLLFFVQIVRTCSEIPMAQLQLEKNDYLITVGTTLIIIALIIKMRMTNKKAKDKV